MQNLFLSLHFFSKEQKVLNGTRTGKGFVALINILQLVFLEIVVFYSSKMLLFIVRT